MTAQGRDRMCGGLQGVCRACTSSDWSACPAPPPSSQDSIKSSQSWFMACAAYAPGLVRLMAQRLVNLQEFDKQLHLIYLANDILFKA